METLTIEQIKALDVEKREDLWVSMSYDQIFQIYCKDLVSDYEIGQIFHKTMGQVAYKRRRLGIRFHDMFTLQSIANINRVIDELKEGHYAS